MVSAACAPAADDLLSFGDYVLGGDVEVGECAVEGSEDLLVAFTARGLPGKGVVIDDVGANNSSSVAWSPVPQTSSLKRQAMVLLCASAICLLLPESSRALQVLALS
jgi:hypothetical protein